MTEIQQFPVLYSYRRCPYAMRARLAIQLSDKQVYLREILLRDKPAIMLKLSPKGTVPVLAFPDGLVLEESLDIIEWALNTKSLSEDQLIAYNDNEFKQHLDHYKYASRFPQHPAEFYRLQGEVFLTRLNEILMSSDYLGGRELSVTDIAILPFIRQFANVDINWFQHSAYSYLYQWLYKLLQSDDFITVMKKYPQWIENEPMPVFP